ncbi:MAG: hypothetical protein JO001_13770 [Alphaproteobacteria bacterium]|nr:hypothetical protein [Alphaproteobacteria bacterium]
MQPMIAPVVAPLAPPWTALAAGFGDCAKAGALNAIPATNAIEANAFMARTYIRLVADAKGNIT